MIVVDASVFVDLLLQTIAAPAIQQRLFRRTETLHAPHLTDLEITQVLRRLVQSNQIDATRGRQALQDYADLRLSRYPHHHLLSRIWELRNNLTAYDAAYVALAEMLDAPLLTRDAALATIKGHHARVELL